MNKVIFSKKQTKHKRALLTFALGQNADWTNNTSRKNEPQLKPIVLFEP